jgi:hypothetical protein
MARAVKPVSSMSSRLHLLTRVEEPSRQFLGKALQRWTVLPDDGKAVSGSAATIAM